MAETATEPDLRKELYQIDLALDTARNEADSVPRLAALAHERQEVQAQLDLLLPAGDMGYQGNEDRVFPKVDIHFVPAPIISGGASR